MNDQTYDKTYGAAHSPIRSYVKRAGRIGSGQRRALEQFSPKYVVPFKPQAPDWSQVFGRSAPLILEVGFGMGSATAEIAATRPDVNFIGIEVHEPGVGALLKLIDEKSLENMRIVQHDAVQVIAQMLAPRSLAGVHIYFPDPWHKKRHHKRRLIQREFVSLLVTRLATGGYLHCASDWEPYAQEILNVLSAEPGLYNVCDGFVPRPSWRPITKFEYRGLQLGHSVRDLLFKVRA